MILILFSDKKYEYQSVGCIKSIEKYLPEDMTILYFTIGYHSSISLEMAKVKTVYYEDKNYISFMYYKPELCLKAMELYPTEDYFFYTDSDVLFSKRIDFHKIKCEETYPLASFGPHEFPFIWKTFPDGTTEIYNEIALMNYLNVPNRTIRYQWACFQSFNRKCIDFYQEYQSLCQNTYLLDRHHIYFPFPDETPFNVCLWKRNANKSLGFIFVNTHLYDTVKEIEEGKTQENRESKVIDTLGHSWEYIHDVNSIVFYHGCKDKDDIEKILNYLVS